jgi:alpha-tubulin suppressor-like RCC1 family protein
MEMKTFARALLPLSLAALIASCGDPAGPEAVATVTVNPPTSTLAIGGTVTLTATTKDASGTELTGRTITWSSEQASVATVNASTGVVTAVASGTATIKATSEGKSGSATITVSAVPVASVSVSNPAAQPMERTLTTQLVATTKDASSNVLTGRVVTWTSSAPTVASVDPATGLVTALDRGTATITATSEGKTATTDLEVIILYRSITAGTAFSCDLGSIGIATCWGNNGGQDGRLGNGPLDNASLADSPTQVVVLGAQRFTQISSGDRHTCGLTSAGAAYCWGSNGYGQLGAPSIPSWAHQPVAVAGGIVFTQISAGETHTCGITAAGAAYCWGENGVGQLGTGNTTDATQPVAVTGGIVFAQISAGSSNGAIPTTCGVATSGKAYCWGSDVSGNIGDGGAISGLTSDFKTSPTLVSGPQTFKAVTVGVSHVCGILTSGAGYCWGDNDNGKLGIGSETAVSSPTALSTSQTFLQIDAGYENTCGVTTTNALYCWGANIGGESGTASDVGQVSMAPAAAASGEWIEVNLGTTFSHTCGILKTRLSVRCMGRNDFGQLGNGTTTGANTANATPVLVTKQQPLP